MRNIYTIFDCYLNTVCWTWRNSDVMKCVVSQQWCRRQLLWCYIVSAMNFIRFTNEIMFIVPALSYLGGIKSGVSGARNSVCRGTVLLKRVKVKLFPKACKRDCFGHFFAMQLWNFNSLWSVHQTQFTDEARYSYTATNSTD